MNLDKISHNIRRLQEMKGLSQAQLAQKSGLSIPSIKKLLAMTHEPRMSTLRKIAKALDVSEFEFFEAQAPLQQVRIRLNKNTKVQAYLLDRVAWWLDEYHFLEDILQDQRSFIWKPLLDEPKQLEPILLAQQARELVGLDTLRPISNVCGLLETYGVKVWPWCYGQAVFTGFCVGLGDQGPAIVVNTYKKTVEQQIFIAVRELGHILMHTLDVNKQSTASIDLKEEEEASLFASHFLMPAEALAQAWSDFGGLVLQDRILKIKRLFGVGYTLVLHRLLQEKYIKKNNLPVLSEQFSETYGRELIISSKAKNDNIEPYPMHPVDFIETRLSYLALRACREGEMTHKRSAEVLNISLENLMKRI